MKRSRIFRVFLSILVVIFIISVSGCRSSKFSPKDSSKDTISNSEGTTEGIGNNESDSNENDVDAGSGDSQTDTDEGNDGTENQPDENHKPVKELVKVKALYLTGWTVGNMSRVDHFIELANNTEINSYVIDIKDDDGYVGYESDISEVKEIGAWKKKYDVDKVLEAFHDNDVHIIGRIVCFKDPVLSSKKPELAVKSVSGGSWKDNKGLTWLDPYNKDSWPYILAIAKEAVEKGFDEIQFDYVRFPNDGKKKAMNFDSDKKKYEGINEFLAYARNEMPDVVLSADVFGIICESPEDTEDIGQHLELIGKDIDYISPMVYPSHYALGQIVNKVRFDKPDLDPYGVVYNSLVKARDRIAIVEDYTARMRPYLQDFTASWIGKGNYQTYGAEQVRQQIKAVYDAGYEEWILWNASNKYSEAAMLKED